MSFTRLGAGIARPHPFTTRYASNLAILLGVVYFYPREVERCDRGKSR